MAHKYQISVVQQELVTYLDQAVKDTETTTERLLQALHVAHQLDLTDLNKQCLELVKQRIEQVRGH